ncbi:hypothetical protein GCM10010517_39820 [Streptosporangium fragile]|uniref:Uncharacterized protein n=1 Tax=Streptosporangium fragile TaxID=46186 RepID=A0ABN3W0X8_9ACTN
MERRLTRRRPTVGSAAPEAAVNGAEWRAARTRTAAGKQQKGGSRLSGAPWAAHARSEPLHTEPGIGGPFPTLFRPHPYSRR